jgi:hypothetical protein
MKIFQTSDIRNITLIGGAKSGKTTLGEAMLFEGGMISRRGSVTALSRSNVRILSLLQFLLPSMIIVRSISLILPVSMIL